jgi:hypothetical protein
MTANNSKRRLTTNPIYFVLMTSLFYPAILGVVFYSMLESFSRIGRDNSGLLLTLAYVGIVVSFSVDFMYTYSSKSTYAVMLFLSDLLVLLLLVVGYTNLIESLHKGTAATLFLATYLIIHAIFICWDLILIPKSNVSALVVTYDAVGLVVTLAGLIFWRQSSMTGFVVLWLVTIFYVFVGVVEIFPRIQEPVSS